jgi:methionine synthase II (cobalamin-independent)
LIINNWVNPDCSLKTHHSLAVISSIKTMLAAGKILQEEANATGE